MKLLLTVLWGYENFLNKSDGINASQIFTLLVQDVLEMVLMHTQCDPEFKICTNSDSAGSTRTFFDGILQAINIRESFLQDGSQNQPANMSSSVYFLYFQGRD